MGRDSKRFDVYLLWRSWIGQGAVAWGAVGPGGGGGWGAHCRQVVGAESNYANAISAIE